MSVRLQKKIIDMETTTIPNKSTPSEIERIIASQRDSEIFPDFDGFKL